MRRPALVGRIEQLVGGVGLRIDDAADGWPSLGSVRTLDFEIDIALFAGRVGLTHRDRDEVERRFQNPGQGHPFDVPGGRMPLLIGLWEDDPLVEVVAPVLVSADPWHREGLQTRYSIFADLNALQLAASTGWHEGLNGAGEPLTYMHPALLPSHVEAKRLAVHLPPDQTRLALATTLAAPGADDSVRERRVTSALVRAARFARDVRDAYDGRCAMCGLGLGLVESAHIYPASAPGSSDEAGNGLALCGNHHRAFDRHLIWIEPDTRAIRLHPAVQQLSSGQGADSLFVSSIHVALTPPIEPNAFPLGATFKTRYEYFSPAYQWAG